MNEEKREFLFIGGCAHGRRLYVEGNQHVALPPDLFHKRHISAEIPTSPECGPLHRYRMLRVIGCSVGAAYVLDGVNEQWALMRIKELAK